MRQVCGFSENRIGLLLTINALMIVLFEMQLIHRIDKKDPLSMIALGTLFVAAGFGLLPLMRSYGFIAATTVLWTIGEMLIFPLSATFIAGRASSENSGAYMGLFTLTFSLSMVISPVSGTWVYNRFGPPCALVRSGMRRDSWSGRDSRHSAGPSGRGGRRIGTWARPRCYPRPDERGPPGGSRLTCILRSLRRSRRS